MTESAPQNFFFQQSFEKNSKNLDVPINVPAFGAVDDTKYSLLSFLTSKRKPDVYMGKNVITARNYRIVPQKNTPPQKLSSIALELASREDEPTSPSKSVSPEENAYDEMKRHDFRYFDTSGNITIKCYNCGEVGHISRKCPYDVTTVCIRCNKPGHEEFDCPQVKCFKCNRIGHKSFDCSASKDIEKCERCKNVGHLAQDCLMNPREITEKTFKKFELKCYFCGDRTHLICPFKRKSFIVEDYNSEEVDLSESEDGEIKGESDCMKSANGKVDNNAKRKRKQIFDDISNRKIYKTKFCPRCAERHSYKECTLKSKENTFDLRRQTYSRTMFQNNESKQNNKSLYSIAKNAYQQHKSHIYELNNSSHQVFFDEDEGRKSNFLNKKEKNNRQPRKRSLSFTIDKNKKASDTNNSKCKTQNNPNNNWDNIKSRQIIFNKFVRY